MEGIIHTLLTLSMIIIVCSLGSVAFTSLVFIFIKGEVDMPFIHGRSLHIYERIILAIISFMAFHTLFSIMRM